VTRITPAVGGHRGRRLKYKADESKSAAFILNNFKHTETRGDHRESASSTSGQAIISQFLTNLAGKYGPA
jgi:hypothetical protein